MKPRVEAHQGSASRNPLGTELEMGWGMSWGRAWGLELSLEPGSDPGEDSYDVDSELTRAYVFTWSSFGVSSHHTRQLCDKVQAHTRQARAFHFNATLEKAI